MFHNILNAFYYSLDGNAANSLLKIIDKMDDYLQTEPNYFALMPLVNFLRKFKKGILHLRCLKYLGFHKFV